FKDAADPKMFPEQISVLGLEPWKASKLYGRCDGRADGQVTLDLTAVSAPLEATVREFAASAASCLGDEGSTIPAKRCFRLVADRFARAGQWNMAREMFLLLVDRYPAHPRTPDALRWLIRHNASGEARRRQELGQFVAVGQVEYGRPKPAAPMPPADDKDDAD